MIRRAVLGSLALLLAAPSLPAGSGQQAREADQRFRLRIVEGQPQKGMRTLRAGQGETVRLTVRTDRRTVVHIHGIDQAVRVPAGESVRMRFEAATPGRFPVELHGYGDHHTLGPILYLEVRPR